MVNRKLTNSDIAIMTLTGEITTDKKNNLILAKSRKKLYNSDVTDKIFENCYWGGFEYNTSNENIYDNRIKFFNEYKIVKHAESYPQYVLQWAHHGKIGLSHCESVLHNGLLDHPEEYIDEDGNFIFVFSPYGDSIDSYCGRDLTIDLVNTAGWHLLEYNIYSNNAITFVLKVDKKEIMAKIKEERAKYKLGLENNLYR